MSKPFTRHEHHCAAKLDGWIIALIELPNGFTVTVTAHDAAQKQFPVMPETMAREAFSETVAALNAISIGQPVTLAA